MKTNFSSKNTNQKFGKECVHCTNIEQKEWSKKNQEKRLYKKKQNFHQNRDKVNKFRKRYENKTNR